MTSLSLFTPQVPKCFPTGFFCGDRISKYLLAFALSTPRLPNLQNVLGSDKASHSKSKKLGFPSIQAKGCSLQNAVSVHWILTWSCSCPQESAFVCSSICLESEDGYGDGGCRSLSSSKQTSSFQRKLKTPFKWTLLRPSWPFCKPCQRNVLESWH